MDRQLISRITAVIILLTILNYVLTTAETNSLNFDVATVTVKKVPTGNRRLSRKLRSVMPSKKT